MLHGIAWDQIDFVWPQCLPLLDKGLIESQNDFSELDIYDALKSRDMQLWVWSEKDQITCVLVTTILRYPQKFICQMLVMGGTGMEDWKDDACEEFYAWARSNNCDSIDIHGRKGWGRALGDGWQEINTHFRRKL